MTTGTKIAIAVLSAAGLGAIIYWGIIPRIPGVGFPSMEFIDWIKKTAKFRYKGKDVKYSFSDTWMGLSFEGDKFSLSVNKSGTSLMLKRDNTIIENWNK